MQPVAVDLGREDLDRVARYYAGLPPPSRPLDVLPDATAAIARGRALAGQGDAERKDSRVRRVPRRRRAEDLSASRRPERALHGQPAAPVERRPRARHGRRGHHGADRARAERAADRRMSRPISPRSARRPRDEAARSSSARRLALGLAGCGTDVQSVLAPGGPQAGQIATLAWLLFGFGAVVLAIVIAALWLAIRGSPRLRGDHSRANAPSSRSGSSFPP